MLYRPITVTIDALTQVMCMCDLGELHVTLAAGAVWVDPETDKLADDNALRRFADLGMTDRGGLRADLIDSLRVLARPDTEYYGWYTQHGITTAVLAASVGSDALLVLRRGRDIQFQPADPRRLAEALVACLPPVPPSRGPSFNVAQSQARVALRSLADHGHSSAQQCTGTGSELVRLWSTPSIGAGELHVARRRRATQMRVTTPYPVGYHDTANGRWWIQVVPGHGDNWIAAAPATVGLLINRLHQAHQGLTP